MHERVYPGSNAPTHLYLGAPALLCLERAQRLAAEVHAPNLSLCNSTDVPIYRSTVCHIPSDPDTCPSCWGGEEKRL